MRNYDISFTRGNSENAGGEFCHFIRPGANLEDIVLGSVVNVTADKALAEGDIVRIEAANAPVRLYQNGILYPRGWWDYPRWWYQRARVWWRVRTE